MNPISLDRQPDELLSQCRVLRAQARALMTDCVPIRHESRFLRRRACDLRERLNDLITISLFQEHRIARMLTSPPHTSGIA